MANLYNQTHRSLVLENKGLKMSLQIFISETMGCESISTIALFYDGSQWGLSPCATICKTILQTVQGVIFMGTGTSPLPLTAALPLLKMAEKQPKTSSVH